MDLIYNRQVSGIIKRMVPGGISFGREMRMKKILCLMLCMVLLLCSAGSLAAANYTLPEKMEKQLSIGSGLKGSLTIHGEGNDQLILALQPFQDVELQFRGLRSGDEAHYYAYQAGDNEEQKGLTEIYEKGDQTWFRTDMLPGEVFHVPGMNEMADLMTANEGGNPSFASAVLRWFRLSREEQSVLLDPVVSSLSIQLELWLARYASVSEVRTLENGTSAVDMVYDIPMSEMKKEIVTLMKSLTENDDGKALINAVMTEEQKGIFANENLDYYYQDALDALDNEYDIMYTRTVSTLGTAVSSTLELPLDESRTRFQSLTIEENGGLVSYTLRNEEEYLTLLTAQEIDWNQISACSFWLYSSANAENGGEKRAMRIDISHSSDLSTDEENKDHERDTWKISAKRDVSRLPEGEKAEDYPEMTPMDLEINLHYYSKYSQSSPTNLEFDVRLTKESFDLKVNGQMKTASPWIFSPFSTENAAEISSLSTEELTVKLAEFLAASGELLTPAEPEDEESDEAAEDAPEADTNPDEAETETSAEE